MLNIFTISSLAMDGVLPRIDVILMNDYNRIRYFIHHTSEEPFFKSSSIIQIYNNGNGSHKKMMNAVNVHQTLQWYEYYTNKKYDLNDDSGIKYRSFLKNLKNAIENAILDIFIEAV